MKKTILLICLLTCTLTTFAQHAYERYGNADLPFTFGVEAGANLASMQYTVQGSGGLSSGFLPALRVGFYLDFKADDNLSFQPALLYMGKGSNDNGSTDIDGVTILSKSKIYLSYLELPANLIYRTPLGQGSFYFGAGMFLATGITGKTVGSVSYTLLGVKRTSSTSKTFVYGSDTTSDIKRIDYGATGLIGYKLENGFFLNVSYDLGLANVFANPNEVPNTTSQGKTRAISIYIGYEF